MRIVILGAGGLGSLIGGYLAHSGIDVTLIGRAPHVEVIRQRGLEISGIRGRVVVRQNLAAITTPEEARGDFDYFLLTVKGKDTDSALAQAAPLRSRVATVFSLQNGIDHDEKLIRWAGADRVIGASTIEGGTLGEPGTVVNTLSTPVTAYFGELDGRVTERVRSIVEAFNHIGLATKAVDNIVQVEWEKLFQIGLASGFSAAALAALPDLRIGDGLTVREGAELYVQLAKELLAVYNAMGYRPQNFYAPASRLKELDDLPFEQAVEAAMEQGRRFKADRGRGRTSMHNDLLQRRKTEVDFIFSPILEKARELRIAIPTVAAIYRIIKTLDANL
ncbi:MAG TPA: ketopantoate reductase family protein [Candidatus Binataceae bacterium]|nr:ketopantoate reductase family protein [Candidatus Binataceae bacterium]